MTDQEILGKLKNIVAPYTQNKKALENLNPKTDFINDLQINSANLVDIILDVEEEFDVTIDDDSMNDMLNVGNAMDVIKNQKN